MLIDITKYIFFKYADEYGIYDEEGCLVDMKSDTPAEVKQSFEEYQKLQAELESNDLRIYSEGDNHFALSWRESWN